MEYKWSYQRAERRAAELVDQKWEVAVAEVLALGISHYPPLAGQDERMAFLHKRMLQNPQLPEAMRDPHNWPEPMRNEWGNDEGASAAARHRDALVGWMNKVRKALDDFNPDYVILFGDDQYENFREDIIPPYCIAAHENFSFHAHEGNVWGETEDDNYEIKGNVAAAKHLASRLIEDGFDMAYSYRPLHNNLGHAFTNAIFYLDYDREKGFPYPIIPIAINCYGRRVIAQRGGLPSFDKVVAEEDLDPPAPTPGRLFDLGGAIARALKDMPGRVALIASSGWSHAFLTAKNYYLHPDTEADRRMYDALKDGDFDTWRNYTGRQVEESGQQEILNWSCLVGALKELGQEPTEMGFVDTWIFNSSKVFLVAPPQ